MTIPEITAYVMALPVEDATKERDRLNGGLE